jgi:RNA polymerase sigma-70 factor (ECF subfamily)
VTAAREDLDAICGAAVAASPELAGLEAELAAHVTGRAHDGALPSIEHAADLGLCFACAKGFASAQRRLDAILTANVARAVKRIDSSSAFADVVAQELRARLLIGEAPKIGDYAGRGSLGGWLRTAATRAALNLRRGPAERGHDPLGSGLGAATLSPDVEVLRARYRGDFEESLRVALRRLPSRERAVLALNVRDGMSCDRIAAIYRVGRSTVKRWLIDARAALAGETKRELLRRCAMTSSEYESVAAGVRSAVDVSIVRLLGESDGDEAALTPDAGPVRAT